LAQRIQVTSTAMMAANILGKGRVLKAVMTMPELAAERGGRNGHRSESA
jgi:hypothetical protein